MHSVQCEHYTVYTMHTIQCTPRTDKTMGDFWVYSIQVHLKKMALVSQHICSQHIRRIRRVYQYVRWSIGPFVLVHWSSSTGIVLFQWSFLATTTTTTMMTIPEPQHNHYHRHRHRHDHHHHHHHHHSDYYEISVIIKKPNGKIIVHNRYM